MVQLAKQVQLPLVEIPREMFQLIYIKVQSDIVTANDGIYHC